MMPNENTALPKRSRAEINHQNSQKSTEPKTGEGKQRSAMKRYPR